MNRDEVIQKLRVVAPEMSLTGLCELAATVGQNDFRSQESYDCFCGKNPISERDDDFQFSRKVFARMLDVLGT